MLPKSGKGEANETRNGCKFAKQPLWLDMATPLAPHEPLSLVPKVQPRPQFERCILGLSHVIVSWQDIYIKTRNLQVKPLGKSCRAAPPTRPRQNIL